MTKTYVATYAKSTTKLSPNILNVLLSLFISNNALLIACYSTCSRVYTLVFVIKVMSNICRQMHTHIYKATTSDSFYICSVATGGMEVKLFFAALVLFILVNSNDAADQASGPGLLQEAIKYLVNYTASEAKTRLNMNNIGSTVAAIAYQELTEKLGR